MMLFFSELQVDENFTDVFYISGAKCNSCKKSIKKGKTERLGLISFVYRRSILCFL